MEFFDFSQFSSRILLQWMHSFRCLIVCSVRSITFHMHFRLTVDFSGPSMNIFFFLALNKIVNRLMKIQRNAYIFNFIHIKFHSWILNSIDKNPNRTRYRVQKNSHVKWSCEITRLTGIPKLLNTLTLIKWIRCVTNSHFSIHNF